MKKLVFGILVIVLLLGIAGCSSKSSTTPPGITYAASTRTSPQWGVAESSGGYYDSYDSGKAGYQPGVTPTITVALPAPTTTTVITTDNGYHNQIGANLPVDRMVIRTASMALLVEDVTASLNEITNLANVNGGYVINSDKREDQSRLYASINFRVDAAKFSDTLQALRNLAVDVRSESTTGQDVTEEYVDLDAQLRNLEASETQLLALMEKAGKVEEILQVQQQLTNTRGQIEQIKGRMQYLQQSTSLSSIYVSLEQSKLTAEFSASASTVKEGDDIRFMPTISGGFEPYSFTWDFGDGKTSTEGSPLHNYKNDGTYTVKLTIKDDKGNTADAVREGYITVLTGWDAGNVVSSAWNGLVGFGRFLGAFFIWVGILSPIWIAILVILYFTWWRRRKKKA